ncbi:DinB family protein [Olivibacter sp. SDN3]|uniref:DinB family protein n=1 Tax=Olivibacter sp. SDN3 TaxID=2764720 RepID=UPI0016514F16|nr:DinB family protein [Olivibacter sp. SDN3]QNL50220.1 DinB family protein [Olivibacter sp. SDN3]
MTIPDKHSLEVWMRGPIDGVPTLLQPVAHALLQVNEDIHQYTIGFSDALLWKKPAGMASAAFHLLHIQGVIDRMFTYAQEERLSEEQFIFLQNEGKQLTGITVQSLCQSLDKRISLAIDQLRDTDENQLKAIRYLGRKRIPTTFLGLLFHAAEHSQRHVGQLLVTIKILQEGFPVKP